MSRSKAMLKSFFLKSLVYIYTNVVAREAGRVSNDSTKTVLIPPPRPKRNPAHPYPRKYSVPYSYFLAQICQRWRRNKQNNSYNCMMSKDMRQTQHKATIHR